MANRIIERPNFEDCSFEPPFIRRRYTAIGWTEAGTVRALVNNSIAEAVISESLGLLYRNDISLNQTSSDMFDVDITYSPRKYGKRDEWTFDFDTTGGTVHISNSKESIKRYKNGASELGSAPATAIPKHFGAIGVEGNEVKGTEIVIPAMRFNVQFRHAQGRVTPQFAKYLHTITGTVNSTAFMTWAPGEVLFLGASGSDGSECDSSVRYSFAMSANQSSLSIGAIANIAKKGWEAIWISYESATEAGYPVRQPKFVYVERVYDTIDMAAALGFG